MFNQLTPLAFTAVLFVSGAFAQSDAPTAKLPSFKTVYKYASNQYTNDISMSEVDGLSGRLKIEGTKCFVDQVVKAEKLEIDYVITVNRMTPRDSTDAAFCAGIKHTLTIPQKAGAFGRVGKMVTVYQTLNNQVAQAAFSFSD